MIAADERTTRIKLATGVISLPYHCPIVVADRLTLLDHLSQGRLIFAAGPGAFSNGAHVLGVDYVRNREHMAARFSLFSDTSVVHEDANDAHW
jgi:limonene 1,2-monooxygenase